MIPTFTFSQFAQQWVNAFAAALGVQPNYVPGSMVLAVAESDAAQAATLQLQAQQVYAFSRAQTSVGPDLDSWMAQFNFPRLPAQYATGPVTFTAPTAAVNPIYIPVGSVVTTPGGAIEYQVIPDPNNSSYSATLNAYILPATQTSINVTCQATLPGQAYNVQANQLVVAQTTVFGISAVSNPSAIINGDNPETDDAYRARFVQYLGSLSKATATALLNSVQDLQAGLKIQLLEGVQAVGNPPSSINSPYAANVVVLVDNGTGSPPTALLNAATLAIANTIAFGVSYQVLPPAVVTPTILMNIRVGPNGVQSVVEANVQAAIVNYVNSLPIGGVVQTILEPGYLYLNKLIEIAIDSDPNVVTVEPSSTTINGVQNDFTVQIYQELVISNSQVTIGTY